MSVSPNTLEGSSGNHILVCSPERHVARLIQVNLERQGYEIQIVESATEVAEALESGALPDRLVVDHRFAYEVLMSVRNTESTKHIHVAVMLGLAEERADWEELEERPDDFHVMPFNPRDLLR